MKYCPHCDYSLKGLPGEHACPECGFRYDRTTHIWRSRGGRQLRIILIGVGLYLGLLLLISFGPRASSFRSVVPQGIIHLGFGTWLLVRAWLIHWRGRFIKFTQGGIHYRLDTPRAAFVPWSNVSRVAVLPPDIGHRGGATLFLRRERTTLAVCNLFRDTEETEEFIRIANVHLTGTDDGVPQL